MTDFSEFSLLAVAFPKIRERLQWNNDAALYVYYASGDCLISNMGVNRGKVQSII